MVAAISAPRTPELVDDRVKLGENNGNSMQTRASISVFGKHFWISRVIGGTKTSTVSATQEQCSSGSGACNGTCGKSPTERFIQAARQSVGR
ncbi:MAG TPA: hypothetical protein VEP30_01020 [Chthoniobacterales bacterium]|nr:hypothetical protein [Chthoniobacterales bacterium]